MRYPIYIYIYARPPPHDPHIWPREGGFGRGGLQTPDFQKKSGVRGPGLQTPDFQKKSGVAGPWTPDSGVCNLESGAAGTPDFFWKSGVWSLQTPGWSTGPRTPDSRSGVPGPWTPDSGVCSGVWGRGYFWKSGVWSLGPRTPDSRFPEKIWRTPDSRFPEKIWSTGTLDYLESVSGTPEKSGVWGPGYSRFFLEILAWSGAPGKGLEVLGGTPDSRFFLEIWSLPGPGYSRFFLEIWSLESGAPGTPDFFWKSGVWSPGPWYSRFFLEI